MRIIVKLGHPGHVHLFKNMIKILEQRGHVIKIIAKDRGILPKLLDSYNFEYEILDKHRKGLLNKVWGLAIREYRLLKIIRDFKPDICVGMGLIPLAHVSRLFNIPTISFTDTEHDKFERFLSDPFVTTICTSTFFNKDLGPKQIRYNGLHELAYLHPNYFKPNRDVLNKLGLYENEKFILIRLVSWSAAHDIKQQGLSRELKRYLDILGNYGKVFISSEANLGDEFKNHIIKIPPEQIHDLMYYATLYIGEGATMASESAMLGTPSIFISTLKLGYLDELQQKYDLTYSFSDPIEALKMAQNLLTDDVKIIKNNFGIKREKLLSEKIDVTKFMIDLIEKYNVNG